MLKLLILAQGAYFFSITLHKKGVTQYKYLTASSFTSKQHLDRRFAASTNVLTDGL